MESCTVVKAAVSYSRLSVYRALASATADDCGLGVGPHANHRFMIPVDYEFVSPEPLPLWQIFGNRATVRIRLYYSGRRTF